MAKRLAQQIKSGRLIGYARVSTEDQRTLGQRQALKEAGCQLVYEDTGSGASRSRKQLELCMAALRPGDTLVVTKLDRFARSVKDLYIMLDELGDRGIFFRSLREDFDSSTAAGKFTLGVLAGVAEFERAIINDRVEAGILAARERGVRFGNPAFIRKDPMAIAMMKATLADTYARRAQTEAEPWIDLVSTHRPHSSWEGVVEAINKRHYTDKAARKMTLGRLMRHVHRLVDVGLLGLVTVLRRSPISLCHLGLECERADAAQI